MKQKKLLILFAASALFAACSSDEGPTAPEKQAAQSGEVPVAFDTYVSRGTTRAGEPGEIVTSGATGTQKDLSNANVGFGVFAYYTNADNYDQTFTPNFMYNEKLYYADSKWQYTPIKYWPNEFGGQSLSDDKDKISFFAYAPYVPVNNPSTGKVTDNTWGIVGMKGNTATGDPMIKYISSFYTNQQVDLLWGVYNETDWILKETNASQGLATGKAWLDVQHPKKTSTAWNDAQKVKFTFLHGLAWLNVTVDTKTNNTALAAPDGNTKVYIRSVTFEGFDTKGALNLNNETTNTALWYNFDCLNELNNGSEVTIKDGRKDGKEGVSAATKEYAAINPTLIQGQGVATAGTGVTNDQINLFATYNASTKEIGSPTDDAAPIFVIPNEDKLKVTIEYDVLTKDPDLVGKLNDGVTNGSVVKNVITRYITSNEAGSVTEPATSGTPHGIKLAAGKKYTIRLHLGLNSVEFDAEVDGWDAPTATETGGADLPHNTTVTP